MSIKIGAYGRGLAYLLGLGSIILATMNLEAWKFFLAASLLVFFFPIFINKKRSNNKRKKRRK